MRVRSYSLAARDIAFRHRLQTLADALHLDAWPGARFHLQIKALSITPDQLPQCQAAIFLKVRMQAHGDFDVA